ncbi:MAG TPA: hypothetical protein VKK61_03490 [Tepidisphaeraceae bacterium]|nr:hypothetical protein [Tepidisphaeraceae bacterium]
MLSCLWIAQADSQTPVSNNLLGDQFESQAAGIALSPPAEAKTIRGQIGSNEVVQFIDEPKKWTIKLTRVLLEEDKPLPLTTWKDKDGKELPGMLELTSDQFKQDTPGAQMLRQDTITVGNTSVGLMVARANLGIDTILTQRAIIRANDLQYFLLVMNSPAPRKGDVEDDAGVHLAAETFSQMVDSVKVLDQTEIKKDQDQRLLRTRELLVNLTERKLRGALQNEQWFRVIRDGQDIGYSYVVEEIARDLPRKGQPEHSTGPQGVLIGIRSRMLPEAAVQLDSESWLFSTFDRKTESWSRISFAANPKTGKSTTGELGVTRWRERPVADTTTGIGAQRNVSVGEEYRLEVTKLARNVSSQPAARDLPPFYLPQAINHLLPRVVPLREPKTYLFATWVSEAGQLMYRYIDVGEEQEVALGGKRVHAVPVKDRVGLEGAVTTHYISIDGSYLGSVNEDSKIEILPTDAVTLGKLWQNVNLTRPGNVEQ